MNKEKIERIERHIVGSTMGIGIAISHFFFFGFPAIFVLELILLKIRDENTKKIID
jgi:hypothetical protein